MSLRTEFKLTPREAARVMRATTDRLIATSDRRDYTGRELDAENVATAREMYPHKARAPKAGN